MAYSSVHLNGNLICAIDIETTGLEVGVHDIIQVCVMPLGPDLNPSKQYKMFHMKLQPKRLENADIKADKVNKGLLTDALLHGTDPDTACDLFDEWFTRLNLPVRKAIIPLAANWAGIDRDFLIEWLGGPLNFQKYFRNDFRDVMITALFLNDQADKFSEPIPFPKVNMGYLCGILGVRNPKAHDAVGDCWSTAQVYQRLLNYRQYHEFYAGPAKFVPNPPPEIEISLEK